MSTTKTVVTACDHNFVWGALLLGLSMRYHGMDCAYHILAYDLTPEDIRVLSSLPNTRLFPTHKTDTRSVCTQKPMAIATADTDIVVWMDADCIVSGNLEKLFVTPDNKLQIRKRQPEENATIFRNYYRARDEYGKIPQRILATWQQDVGDLKSPRIDTVYQSNCFVLNRSHRDFISLWQSQMLKVIPSDTEGVYNKSSAAYFMTDESVLSSLFAFSSQAPQTAKYLMDIEPDATCIHFGLKPKPWQALTLQGLRHIDYIDTLINWGAAEKIFLPALPASFRLENRKAEYRRAHLRNWGSNLRYNISTALRAALRFLK
ncbi:MAG: hypothetical protein M0R69_08330 [Candidatus Cloacimonetes bacterium]|jgi:hypothetical protein|nr:hypothetical protein [Candidatus Cloacimonadota bacterium]